MSRMRTLPLGNTNARALPLGYAWRSPRRSSTQRLSGCGVSLGVLGQDDDSDVYDDLSSVANESPIVPTATTYPDLSAPAISSSDTSGIYFGVGPSSPSELAVGTTDTDLGAQILAGNLSLPSGSPITQSQLSTLQQAGASSADIDNILSGSASYASVLSALAQGTTAAAAIAKTAMAASGVSQIANASPTVRTCPTAPSGYSYQLNAAGQCTLEQGSLISGIPDWVTLGGLALVAVLAIAGSK